jgi:predicted transcriptional regulator
MFGIQFIFKASTSSRFQSSVKNYVRNLSVQNVMTDPVSSCVRTYWIMAQQSHAETSAFEDTKKSDVLINFEKHYFRLDVSIPFLLSNKHRPRIVTHWRSADIITAEMYASQNKVCANIFQFSDWQQKNK